MHKIVPIVEGQGEVKALPNLLAENAEPSPIITPRKKIDG